MKKLLSLFLLLASCTIGQHNFPSVSIFDGHNPMGGFAYLWQYPAITNFNRGQLVIGDHISIQCNVPPECVIEECTVLINYFGIVPYTTTFPLNALGYFAHGFALVPYYNVGDRISVSIVAKTNCGLYWSYSYYELVRSL